jgi:protein-disulfide isomerase
MSKNLNHKARSEGSTGMKSWLMPAVGVLTLMVLAVGVAILMVHRYTGTVASSTPSTSLSTGNFKPVVTPDGWTQGNTAAKTILVEFGDFQCGACAAARKPVANIMKNHGNEVRLVFKQFPMDSVHRNSMIAAQAAEAAGRQFKYWEMHEQLFLHQTEWAGVPDPQTFFLTYAQQLGLDLERFKQDLWDGAIREKIYRDILEGQVAGVRSVPTFFLNGSLMPRPQNEGQFEEIITDAIKKNK